MPIPSTTGDIGTVLFLDLGVDVSAATVALLKIKKPNGNQLTKTASINGTALSYPTIAGDLDESGEYAIQAYLEIGGWKGHSEPPATFQVSAPVF